MKNFIEITLWHGCSPANLLHIFITPFSKNTSGGCFYLPYFKKLSGIILPLEVRDDDIQMSDIKFFLWFYMLTQDTGDSRTNYFNCNNYSNILSKLEKNLETK